MIFHFSEVYISEVKKKKKKLEIDSADALNPT